MKGSGARTMFRQSLRSRSRSRPNEEESEDTGPPAPLPTDVIVGRGKGAYLSDGNRRFTQTIRSFLPVYNQTKTTQEKVQVTNNIVDHIKSNGGRFLRIDNKGKLHPVPDKEARIKVAQVSEEWWFLASAAWTNVVNDAILVCLLTFCRRSDIRED